MRILFLDDDDDLREVMGQLLGAHAHDVVPVASYQDLVAHGDEVLRCQLAILDINLGPDAPTGVDAYEWLEAHGFAGEVVFLSGHTRSRVQRSSAFGPESHERLRVLEKPISVDQLTTLIEGVPT